MPLSTDVPGYIESSFYSAESFLTALLRGNQRWGAAPGSWIFRGQSRAAWHLTPVVFRDRVSFPFSPVDVLALRRNHFEQMLQEGRIIQSFLHAIDRQGLPLPVEAAMRWFYADDFAAEMSSMVEGDLWPPIQLAPLFALAQHHGIPTRLLDWSERPWIAAYFAAVSAAESGVKNGASGDLAVWALHLHTIELLHQSIRPGITGLRLVRAPRSTNPNLRAQEGVFTLIVDQKRGFNDSAYFAPLDELVLAVLSEMKATNQAIDQPVLQKLTLPIREAPKLLRLLADEGVSALHLYPGIDGVVKALKERGLWEWSFGTLTGGSAGWGAR